jgi:predicted dehydrogenase
VPRCRLAALCNASPEELEPWRDGYATFADSRELIRSGAVDAVLIATPHYAHTTIGIDALEHGLHVLVDKPISVHKKDCERLIAAHTDARLVFAAMFQVRTDPRYQRAKQLVDDGALGRLQRVSWIATDWFRTQVYYDSSDWRATWAGEGGGVLLNQCPHNLDMLWRLCGMPARVRAFAGLGKYHEIEAEDEITAYLEFADGATGTFVTTTGETPGTNRLEIAGDRGLVVVEPGRVTLTRNEPDARTYSKTTDELFGRPETASEEFVVEDQGTQHAGIIANFVNAILDGEPLIAPAEEGIHSVELANAMLYSALNDVTVELPLDGDAYEAFLKKRIAGSTLRRRVVERKGDDMSGSFR